MGFMLALKYDDASCDDYAQATVARHGQLIASMRDTASLPYYGLPLFAAREGDKLEDIFAESERLRYACHRFVEGLHMALCCDADPVRLLCFFNQKMQSDL